MTVAMGKSPAGCCYQERKPKVSTRAELETYDSEIVRLLLAEGVQTTCCVPLVTRDRVIGTLNLASLRDAAFTQEDVDLLGQVAGQVAIAVENALATCPATCPSRDRKSTRLNSSHGYISY